MKDVIFRQLLQEFSDCYENIHDDFKMTVKALAKARKEINDEAKLLHWKQQELYPTYNDALTRELECYISDDNKTRARQFDKLQKMLQAGIAGLERLEFDLGNLRTTVDKRGFGIFKFGNMKKEMDRSLSPLMIRNLREDMQTLLNAFNNARFSFDVFRPGIPVTPIMEWLKAYRSKQKQSSRFSETPKSPYEVIMII